jgi:hypothetical protein
MRKALVSKRLTQRAPVASDGNSNDEEAHRARQRLVVCHRTDKWATIDYRTRDIHLLSSRRDSTGRLKGLRKGRRNHSSVFSWRLVE